jgi:hypothetical protein
MVIGATHLLLLRRAQSRAKHPQQRLQAAASQQHCHQLWM